MKITLIEHGLSEQFLELKHDFKKENYSNKIRTRKSFHFFVLTEQNE